MYENSKIIAMARSLGKILQTEPEYTAFYAACDANDKDTELQELIGRFNLAQMNLDVEMKSEERNVEKIEKFSAELDETYAAIMNNENMLAYQSTRQTLEGLMQYVNAILVGAMNGQDPDTISEPTSCSGNCASCGGCGDDGCGCGDDCGCDCE
ncbi:MAG: YlbF family regulator [Oscillospiraceae bacterium]|nr:YlbF family regulator [Oscillospiraceae bacterium]